MTVKIGIITDDYHFKNKLSELFNYLKDKADIRIYLEQDYLLSFENLNFNEDIFFVKTKGDLALGLVRFIERETSIPVINSYSGIFLAMHRFLNSIYLQRNSIRVPNFALYPINKLPPFNNYIIKNLIDQKNYVFEPQYNAFNDKHRVIDKRALEESHEEEKIYHYYYYQEFIESEWEYKVYGVGDEIYFYKQIPILMEPNKTKTRKKIPRIPELEEMSLKAMEALNLKIASMDFLKSERELFYLTDINSTPNFTYMERGAQIIGDFLMEQAKK